MLDSRWFKEDRALPKEDQRGAMEASTKALKNSTFMSRRLDDILNEMLEAIDRNDEDFTKNYWERQAVANIARRKVLLEIKKLLP